LGARLPVRSARAYVAAAKERTLMAKTKTAHPIRVGVGGWSYEPWEETFYPPKLSAKKQLNYMAGKLTGVEVNGTFYRTQTAATFQKWAGETPDGFVFALKAHRMTTSRKTAPEMEESINWFLNSGVLALGDKLGPINWQFHPSKKFDADYFGAFLKLLPPEKDGVRVRHAIEVRHASFNTPEFHALLKKHGAAMISADDDDWATPDVETADFAYARLQRSREKIGYPAGELDDWAGTFKDWAKKREVFAFFISGAKETNPAAAMALIERVG